MADSGNTPPPPKGSSEAKKTQNQGLDYLAYLISYFKTCGFVLPIWLIGYLTWSPLWVMVGLFAYMMGEEYRKVKQAKLDFAKKAVLNEKEAILARVDELPSWVSFHVQLEQKFEKKFNDLNPRVECQNDIN